MKKLISYFLLITICVTTLFRFQGQEVNAVVKDIYEAYSVDTVDAGMVYYIKDTPSPKVVYCFNSSKKQPPLLTSGEKLPQYTKLDYLTSTDVTTISAGVKEQIAALLYVGYPNDALGLQAKYQLSDDKARYYTQSALWCLIRGDKWFGTDETYETEIGNYAINNGFYGDGTIELKGDFQLSKKGDKWESDVIIIEGTYKDSIAFQNIPSEVKIINSETDKEVDSGLKVGESFYLTYTGDAANLSTFNITYKYNKSNVDFYKLINDTTGIDYQNLIGLEQEVISKNITFEIKNDSGDNSNDQVNIPQINATVTINKFEEGTTNRVVGAVLRLYEGSSEQGTMIKEWTTTNAAEIIKVEPGKTYTLVEVSAPEGYKIASPITFTVEKNTVVNGDSISIIEDNTDYVGFRSDDQMKYISDGVSKAVVYCINKDLRNPDYSPSFQLPSLTDSTYPHYRHWTLSGVSDNDLYENQTQDFKREQLAELLLAGYPNDCYGYKVKHSLSDYTAYTTTQMLLDEVLAGKTSYKKTDGLQGDLLNQFNYYNDLLTAYLDPKIDNSPITIDFFNWVEGTGKQDEIYQNLVGITPFSNDISMEVTMEDKIDDTISILVEKLWEDNNQVGDRPSEVEVQIYKDGQPYGDIVKLNENNSWKYQWNNLSASNIWTVDEVNVPEGYIKNITEKDNNFTITNTKIVGKLEITKTDITDGILLPNAGFKIYDENMNLITEGYTDEKGVVSFELGYGKYFYQEFAAPEGYVLDEKLFPFEIKINGEVVKAKANNAKILGTLEITKKNNKDGTLLPNAGFKIYDEDMNLVDEKYTNENGVLTIELNAGKYYYQEFDAPEGYLLDENLYEFEITKDKEVIKVEALNTKAVVISVEKVWEDNNQEGSRPDEVEVQLYRDGKPYGNIVKLNESNDWKYQWSDLSSDYTWTVDEVNVPEGYIKNITEKDNNFTITNTKIVGKLEITKTDITDGTLLPNAGFKIYDENMNLITEGYTDEKGVVSFELGYGKYFYQEFSAPEGYVLDEELFPFEIKINGEVVKAQMTNKKLELSIEETDSINEPEKPNNSDPIIGNEEDETNNKLPNTGGINSNVYFIFGLILILFGLKLFNIKYKYEN